MSRRLIALVFAVLLTASSVFVVVHGASGTAPTPGTARPSTAVAPAVSTLSPTIVNGEGLTTTTFNPGATYYGAIFFVVVDSNAGDKQVNITLTDPNATRDGVAAPAFHLVANLNSTTHSYDSWTANVGYTFPASLAYNDVWTANFSETSTNYVDVPIEIQVYQVNLTDSVGYVAALPGSPLTIFWNLTSTGNGASLYTKATNVFITGTYFGNGTTDKLFHPANTPLAPANAGLGTWKGTVPDNATPNTYLRIEVYAYTNVSGVTIQNESSYIYVSVGGLDLYAAGIEASPGYCTFNNYSPFGVGSTVTVCLQAYVTWFGERWDLQGAQVTLNYWNGTAHVTPTGATTATTTNSNGRAIVAFVANAPPFGVTIHQTVADGVNLTLTAPGADTKGYLFTVHDNITFVLVPALTGDGYVNVSLDKTQYYIGSTATVTWSIHSTDPAKTGAIDPVAWALFYGGAQQAITPLNTTAQSGTFTVPVTAAMLGDTTEGYFAVDLYAANASTSFGWFAFADVIGPTLLLTSSSLYYSAGSTLSFTPETLGAGVGTVINYQVVGDWDYSSYFEANLSAGVATNNTAVSVTIPSSAPPQYVYVEGWLTLGGVVLDTAEAEFSLLYGYGLQFGVTTPSSYSDGSYQPGQTVTLSYDLYGVGGAPLPQLALFVIEAVNYPTVSFTEQAAPSGTFSFTIPSNAVEGSLQITMYVDSDLFAPCFDECRGNATLPINPHPSVLSMELGAGSGITVGWLILLVLVIAVGAVLAVLMLRRGRAGRRGTGSSGTSGSGAPPPEWKEPATASTPPAGGSPPTPPPGST